MQGIYQGYPVMLHDTVWTVMLTLTQDEKGTSHYAKAIDIIVNSGKAEIVKN